MSSQGDALRKAIDAEAGLIQVGESCIVEVAEKVAAYFGMDIYIPPAECLKSEHGVEQFMLGIELRLIEAKQLPLTEAEQKIIDDINTFSGTCMTAVK